MIEGKFPGDPWHHLIQAKGYQEIGEHERADAELTAAVTETPNDPRDLDGSRSAGHAV